MFGHRVGRQRVCSLTLRCWLLGLTLVLCSSAPRAPLTPVVAGSSQHQVSLKTKTLGCEQKQIQF